MAEIHILVLCADKDKPTVYTSNLAKHMFPGRQYRYHLVGNETGVPLRSVIGTNRWWGSLCRRHPYLKTLRFNLVVEESCPVHSEGAIHSTAPLTTETVRVIANILTADGNLVLTGLPAYVLLPNGDVFEISENYVTHQVPKEPPIPSGRKWCLVPYSSVRTLLTNIETIL